MLFLLLAILCSSMVSIVMRISGDKIKANISMLAVNYIVCALLGAAYTDFNIFVPQEDGFTLTLGLGVVGGVLFLASFILLQVNTKNNGVVLSSLFMKLGLLVPILLSIFFFGELPTAVQIAGFCISIGAIILINYKKGEQKRSFGWGLIALLTLGGCAESMAKIYEHIGTAALSQHFLFYVFGSALILCIALIIIKKERPGISEIIFGTLIGIPNFFSTKCLLMALRDVPAVIAYPTSSVGTILLVTLCGVLVFKERPSKLQWIALAAIVVALVLLNI